MSTSDAPAREQLAGERVPQPVRADRARCRRCRQARWTTSPTRSARIGRVGALTVKNTCRRRRAPAAQRQVAGQRLADVRGQRQPVVAARLAADHELAGAPVEVLELASGRPRSSADRAARAACMIAKSRWPTSRAAVAAVEQPLDVRGGHRGRRQGGETPPTDRRHRRSQRRRGEALQMQEPQDRPQLSHPPLGRPSRDTTALPQQEGVDIRPGQRRGREPLLHGACSCKNRRAVLP